MLFPVVPDDIDMGFIWLRRAISDQDEFLLQYGSGLLQMI